MEEQQIIDLISVLRPKKGVFVVESFPGYANCKIGIDDENNIVILTPTINTVGVRYSNSKTRMLSVLYDEYCEVLSSNISTKGKFSLLILKEQRLLYYFLSLYRIVVERVGQCPNVATFKCEVDTLRMMFGKVSQKPKKTILGIWGELFVIQTSKDPDYLIYAWHKSPSEITDFNDGKCKLEVKATSQGQRIHTFSSRQLGKLLNRNTLIASIVTSETDLGVSVNKLMEMIRRKVKISTFQLLIEKVVDVLGLESLNVSEFKFDYQTALSSIAYFKIEDIPKINEMDIPKQVLNVKFDVLLDDIPRVRPSILTCSLFNSLY